MYVRYDIYAGMIYKVRVCIYIATLGACIPPARTLDAWINLRKRIFMSCTLADVLFLQANNFFLLSSCCRLTILFH